MKLIATNISNLTDARFFAAYAPEVLALPWASGVELANSLQWLGEVIPWIEGPAWAVCWNERNTNEDVLLLRNTEIKIMVHEGNLPIHAFTDFEFIPLISGGSQERLSGDQVRRVILSDVSQLSKIALLDSKIEVYLTMTSMSDWTDVKSLDAKIHGIVLQGSQEEKVGVKSFDEIQNLLEGLELP